MSGKPKLAHGFHYVSFRGRGGVVPVPADEICDFDSDDDPEVLELTDPGQPTPSESAEDLDLQRGELFLYFQTCMNLPEPLRTIHELISVDNVRPGQIEAEFPEFLEGRVEKLEALAARTIIKTIREAQREAAKNLVPFPKQPKPSNEAVPGENAQIYDFLAQGRITLPEY